MQSISQGMLEYAITSRPPARSLKGNKIPVAVFLVLVLDLTVQRQAVRVQKMRWNGRKAAESKPEGPMAPVCFKVH